MNYYYSLPNGRTVQTRAPERDSTGVLRCPPTHPCAGTDPVSRDHTCFPSCPEAEAVYQHHRDLQSQQERGAAQYGMLVAAGAGLVGALVGFFGTSLVLR